MSSWKPSCDLAMLQQRAQLFAKIRDFFAQRNVLEVHTPTLAPASVTDPHLVAFATELEGTAHNQTLYLQTSPEFHMKRLLCAGSGCIYQLWPAYRNEEVGRLHQPEFTMLEWYRVGFDDHQLMDEMAELLQTTLGCAQPTRISYQAVFEQQLGLCPLSASLTQLQALASEKGHHDLAQSTEHKDTLLQLLFALHVEPLIGQTQPVMVYHFPASQAALAQIDPLDPRVAKRFEVYFKGIELANGFHELQDAQEQKRRFAADNAERAALGRPSIEPDTKFLDALEAGLPNCAGVALGVDRLLMLTSGADQIAQVQPFALS
jgi:lysyl-tRNA synthetase class 2